MAKCITIADIAQKLNLSRNTVSKALNGKHVPDKTKREVLQAAAELGYKSFSTLDNAYINLSGKNILLISSNMLMNIPFHVHVMRGMENELAKLNMGLLGTRYLRSLQWKISKNILKNLKWTVFCAWNFSKKI